MSLFYYFISERQLPSQVIDRAHSIHYSLEDVTRYVRDARKGYWYYNCDPVSIYTTNTRGINIKEILKHRYSQESNYLLWMAEEFNKLGSFKFIRVWEDNTKCGTGYYERFFRRCKQQNMDFMNFCFCLASNERGLEDDVLYTVY
jgi:hypothetical protein